MRRARILMATLAMLVPAVPLLGSSATVAHAAACTGQPGGPYPNDPQYAPAEKGVTGATWDGEDWYLYGCTPITTAPLASDPTGASGMSVSDLWNRATNPQRGRDDVVVSYVEGGVNWRIPTSCELKDRAELNTGELPYPEDASGNTKSSGNRYDLNNDGVVNVEDYVHDPRVLAGVAGQAQSPGVFLHHVCSTVGPGFSDITPEDLIVAFGHCQISNGALVQCPPNGRFDNDGNGYPNDINGWNFNRDNNDPQTEQSVYEHFDGKSSQLVGEGDNNFASIGMCPLCRYVPIKAGDEAIDRPDRVAEAIVYAADIGVNVLDVTSASLGLNQSVQDAINYAYNRGTVVVFASNDFEVRRPHRRHVLRARVAGQLDHRRPLDAQRGHLSRRVLRVGSGATPPSIRAPASPRTGRTRCSRCPTTTVRRPPGRRRRPASPRWSSPRASPLRRAARSRRRSPPTRWSRWCGPLRRPSTHRARRQSRASPRRPGPRSTSSTATASPTCSPPRRGRRQPHPADAPTSSRRRGTSGSTPPGSRPWR